MRIAKKVFWLGLISVIVLSACGGDVSLGSLDNCGLNPTPQLTLEEAEQVAETFLQAWRASDYEAMYTLISPNAREAYTLESFTDEYSNAALKLTLNELETHTDSSLRQGTTAAVMYNVIFKTASFGDLTDDGRTMRLIETPEGWRVAWSRMDIFAELAEGARLELTSNQPGRGNIYDRNGNVLVDQNGQMVELYIVRQDLTNEEACIQALSRILVRETADLQAKFDAFSIETRFLVGQVDPETYTAESQALR